jgi:predicted aldo/keto reductase-like oxidoreductase
MRYRKLGKTGLDVSILGFGAMRLPMVGNPGGMAGFDPNIPIEEVEATKMVEYAVERGINYFDTAYGYHGGKSEAFLGKTLKKFRPKVLLATKLPPFLVQKPEDFERLLSEQLGKLGTDYLDFYLVHGLDGKSWTRMKEMGVLEFLDRMRTGGRIRFAGFSFHDELKVFKQIVDGYDWDMCQIQYNFYDQIYQAGKEGLAYAASRGLGVVIMEPLRGGRLTGKIPPSAQALWNGAKVKRSPAEWAMRWIWNHADVSLALTGSSSLAQLKENVRAADNGAAASLSPEEIFLVDEVRATYRKMLKVDCTGCGYCVPCPNGVNIPGNFSLYNDVFLFDGAEHSAFFYNKFMTPEQRASGCLECLLCEDKCTQKIKIAEALKEVHKTLGDKSA